MNVSDAIAKRRSIRSYTDQTLPTEDVQRIVEAGRWAPNVGEFHMAVVTNPDLLSRINERTHHVMATYGDDFLKSRAALPGYEPLYGAPLLIMLSAPEDAMFAEADALLPAENMLLQATELDYGSCFIVTPAMALNRPEEQALAREAGVPEGYQIFCAVLAGYRAAENRYSQPTEQRKPRGTVTFRE